MTALPVYYEEILDPLLDLRKGEIYRPASEQVLSICYRRFDIAGESRGTLFAIWVLK